MPAKKTQVKEVTTHLVHLAGAVSLQDGDLVGELLAEWAVSSPDTRRQFVVAVRLAQLGCVRGVRQEAITKYASEALPPNECCELILNLRVPKSAWCTLSKVYTLRGLKYTAATGLPFARPICPERAFQQRWQELLAPLELEPPVSTSNPKATGVNWPWASWLRYIASQPPLCRMIDWSFPFPLGNRAKCLWTPGGLCPLRRRRLSPVPTAALRPSAPGPLRSRAPTAIPPAAPVAAAGGPALGRGAAVPPPVAPTRMPTASPRVCACHRQTTAPR